MKIGILQFDINESDTYKNFQKVEYLVSCNKGANLYLLPELWSTGYSFKGKITSVKNDSILTKTFLKELAIKAKCFIGGTMVDENSNGFLVNRFYLFSPEGNICFFYDKIHLFRGFEEEKYFQAGKKIPPEVKIQDFTLSSLICYDLRFPEIFRKLTFDQTNLFLVSSCWPESRIHVMNVLAEARAIENQCFLVVSNRIGEDQSGIIYGGNSGAYGPEGLISKCEMEEDVLMIDFEFEKLQLSRNSIVSFRHLMIG